MGELQPIQYLYMFNNILSWTTTILITILVRKNLLEIKSKNYGVNYNLTFLNFFPMLNIFVLPYLLRNFEKNSIIKDKNINFGFKYSLANSFLLTLAALVSYMPSYFLKKTIQGWRENAGENSSILSYLASENLLIPIFGFTMFFIIMSYAGICILIYKQQKNSIRLMQQYGLQ